MKILQTRYLIRKGSFPDSPLMDRILGEITESILSAKWPHGSDKFSLLPGKHRNGVKPIKDGCMAFLRQKDWTLELRVHLGSREKPGKIDAAKNLPDGRYFAFEWETGNISSTHRALNKMGIGLLDGILAGGILVLPSRAMYRHLTDRVGNYNEIQPYFPVWECLEQSTRIHDGVLAVIEVEHDDVSDDAPPIPKGTDGRALR